MTHAPGSRLLSRRTLLRRGGAVAAAGVAAPAIFGLARSFAVSAPAVNNPGNPVRVHLAATDGWISLAGPPISYYFPDPAAPVGQNTYIFGFRDVTPYDALAEPAKHDAIFALRNKAQACSPLLWFDENDEVLITVTNLGLAVRPDLTDGHTLHWHGFRNALPRFDGIPETSVAIPIGRDLPYLYRPRNAGTYMYHCHFEDVEHVQMGMTGIVFVRPVQNKGAGAIPPGKYVYNDGDGSTAYDREFAILTTEFWLQSHFNDAHIQESDWSNYRPEAWMLNGRSYPDTLVPGWNPLTDPPARADLEFQPVSSLVTCATGEKVLIRLSNLGYQQHSMTAPGIAFRVVGRDATLLRGRDGTDTSYVTDTVDIGPGESFDLIFTAPAVGTYLFYDRNLANTNGGASAQGGQMTEIRVVATLPPQSTPNA